jgi:lysophospholipase L1-like esterase
MTRTARRALLGALTLLAAAAPARAQTPSPVQCAPPRDPAAPTLFHIGDSTVRNGNGTGANGEWGWGDLIAVYLDTARLNVVNCALGGTSSRTFLTRGHWDKVLAHLKRGDVVVMQFGHNDGGALNDTSRARGSIRGVGEEAETIDNLLTKQRETVHSYGWYLRKFIADARARGARPIVASPIPRNIWRDGRVARDSATYAGWAERVARAAGAPFVDLNELVAREYEALGAERVRGFFPRDHTHTALEGARLNARVVVGALKGLPANPLGAYLSDSAAAVRPLVR